MCIEVERNHGVSFDEQFHDTVIDCINNPKYIVIADFTVIIDLYE
jgi:hypothetical protein